MHNRLHLGHQFFVCTLSDLHWDRPTLHGVLLHMHLSLSCLHSASVRSTPGPTTLYVVGYISVTKFLSAFCRIHTGTTTWALEVFYSICMLVFLVCILFGQHGWRPTNAAWLCKVFFPICIKVLNPDTQTLILDDTQIGNSFMARVRVQTRFVRCCD